MFGVRWSGKSALSQLSLDPFYLIDHNLSPSFAPVFTALGYKVTSVKESFPNHVRVPDEEIIDWLAARGRQNAVWVTADEDAKKTHAKLILARGISVMWVFRPKKGLSGLQELQLLSLVIEHVTDLVAATTNPIYLQASMNSRRPKLERLISDLSAPKLVFQRIPLPK